MSTFFRRGPTPDSRAFEKHVERFFQLRGAVSKQDLIYTSPAERVPRHWIQAAYKVYEARVQAWERRRAALRAFALPQRAGGCAGYVDPFSTKPCKCLWHGGFRYYIEGDSDSDLN